jgi:hypothetical protein
LGANFTPGVKVHPWVQTHELSFLQVTGERETQVIRVFKDGASFKFEGGDRTFFIPIQ